MQTRILQRIETARATGTSTHVQLIRQQICIGRVCPRQVYHVGLLVHTGANRRIFEHGPVQYDHRRSLEDGTITVPLPTVWNSIDDIAEFESTLPKQYLIGVRDCRHHVLDLLDYLYEDS